MTTPNPVQPIHTFPPELPFRIGHSTYQDGNMSYTFGPGAEVLANRQRFFAKEQLPTHRLATFFTEHQEIITDLEQLQPPFPFGNGPIEGQLALTTDVIVTTTPGTGIFLGFADCVPFVVCDIRRKILAFAHIGWRSMAKNLASKTINHLCDHYQSQPEDLLAVIGPSIKPKSYQFEEAIQWQDPQWHPFLEKRPNGKTAIDLFRFCIADCKRAQLTPNQIYAHQTDTATDPSLFSHYQATEGGEPHKQGRHFFYGYLKP